MFQSFNLAFQKCQYDFEKIALLRQILKIYSAAVNNHASQQDLAPLNNLLQTQSQSSNQTIQTLSTIHLITSTKDPNTIVKLSVLLPSLSGELKHSALELIMTLTSQPQVYNFLVPILQKFLKSQDAEIRKVGFQSISEIIKKTDDAPLKTRLTHQLIENFDDTDDPAMSRQLCAQLTALSCETEEEARELCVGLWQRALLDNVQIRLAAIQALSRLARSYPGLRSVLQRAVDVQQDGFIQEVLAERKEVEIANFNLDDICDAAEGLMSGSVRKVEFKARRAETAPQRQTIQERESELVRQNPGWASFAQVFTNGQYQALTGQNDDVLVEVCKVFYFREKGSTQNVQVLFAFRASAEELTLDEAELVVGGKTYSGTQVSVVKDFASLEEAGLEGLSFRYVLEGEEDEIRLADVAVDTYDLTADDYVEGYEELFEGWEEHPHKYTLAEIQSIDELVDNLPATTSLRLEDLRIEGKHAHMWLMGTVLGAGPVVVRVEAKVLKAGGVGVKMDFRGPAAEQIIGMFE